MKAREGDPEQFLLKCIWMNDPNLCTKLTCFDVYYEIFYAL